jgi:hypothetical protein
VFGGKGHDYVDTAMRGHLLERTRILTEKRALYVNTAEKINISSMSEFQAMLQRVIVLAKKLSINLLQREKSHG